MTWAGDASIRDNWNIVLACQLRHVVHCRGLSSPASTHLLCRADGANAHADSQTICSTVDQVLCLALGDNISSDDLQLWELLLDPLDHVMLEGAVSLAAVNDNGIDTCSMKQLHAVFVLWARANGGGHTQPLLLILGCQRELGVLCQVLSRNDGCDLTILGHDWQLSLFALLQCRVRGNELNTFTSCDQVLGWGHDLLNCHRAAVGDKVGVTLCHKSKQSRAHCSIFSYWKASEATLCSEHVKIRQEHVWPDTHWINNEAALVLLDLCDLLNLVIDGQVGVDDAQPSLECHRDGHPGLGHGIHWARDNWRAQSDRL
mmetsp:Transcript_4484/g.9725  ORF Transcript_4484/g.9725 Transcript_4484/m.9725 type:complete len:316 (+) Transcript_4484:285-1232(+)